MFSKQLFSGYEDKKVLICGASCLTGRNLFDLMQTLGADVRGTCLTDQHYYADGRPMFRVVDFTNREQAARVFTTKYDYVFLCAAQSYNAATCKDNPEVLILPNLTMTSNILEFAYKSGAGRVMFLSSSVTSQPHTSPLYEEDLDLNQDPYPLYLGIGWVKRYLEKLCKFYSRRGLPCTVVRLTNVYGRYDKTDPDKCHVIPALVMRGLNRENPFVLKSLGNGVKNFVHVNDVVRDMAKAMLVEGDYNVFNLTGDESVRIADLVTTLLDVFREIDPTYSPRLVFEGHPDGAPYVRLSRDKFDEICGRESYIPLRQGLKEVIEWYSLSLQTQKR